LLHCELPLAARSLCGRNHEGRHELAGEVLRVIRGVAKAGMTMIIVTHEVLHARHVADRIVFVDDGGYRRARAIRPVAGPSRARTHGVSCAGSPMRKILPPESDLRSGARKLYMLGER
jgi:energy-coupling factor transporter ATP-binding protein EcfA2